MGSALLSSTLMEKIIDFVKIKFHLNQNIEWLLHKIWNLNWVQIDWIEKKKDKNWWIFLWKSIMIMVLAKKTLKRHKCKIKTFSFLFIWKLVKSILIWNYHSKGQHMKLKLGHMNHDRGQVRIWGREGTMIWVVSMWQTKQTWNYVHQLQWQQ